MKAKPKVSALETAWKEVLVDVDKSRLRKAKQDARTGGVLRIRKETGGMSAQVRVTGQVRATYQVFIPWLADFTSHQSQVAEWIARRPSWVAAHFAGEWEPSFVQFLKENQLPVFPDKDTVQRLVQNVKCTCSDWQPLCLHALMVIYDLIFTTEVHPLAVFRFVGLEEETLLDEAHQFAVKWTKQQDITTTSSGSNGGDVVEQIQGKSFIDWVNDEKEVTPNSRLVPLFDEERLRKVTEFTK